MKKIIILSIFTFIVLINIGTIKAYANTTVPVSLSYVNSNGQTVTNTYNLSIPDNYEKTYCYKTSSLVAFKQVGSYRYAFIGASDGIGGAVYQNNKPSGDTFIYFRAYSTGITSGLYDSMPTLDLDTSHITFCSLPIFNDVSIARTYVDSGFVSDSSKLYRLPDGYVLSSDGLLIDKNNAPYLYDSTIPTPSNLKMQFILPKGLFPSTTESQIKLTWMPSAGDLHTEISLSYSYTSNGSKIIKLAPFIKYKDGLFSSVGSVTKKMQTDIETAIHNYDSNTSGLTFANGKLNLNTIYVRYALFQQNDAKLHYGNWVKVSLLTGGSIDNNNPQNTYDEVKIDDDGNETKVTGGEYNGTVIDNNGGLVDTSKLSSLQDYLMAIPNILGSFFSSINGLISSIGSFGAFFTVAFGSLPPVVPLILVSAIFAIVAVGIIKLFK